MQQAEFAATSWTNVIADIGRVSDAAGDFLSGVARIIKIPHTTVSALSRSLDRLVFVGEDWANLELDARNWLRSLDRQMDRLAMFPKQFSESLDTRAALRRKIQLGPAAYSASELATASGSLTGTGARSTDTLRAAAAAGSTDPGGYAGFVEVEVSAQDTPDGLAARWGVPWADIAAANGLRAPYFTDTGLPATVAPGDRITVPVKTGASRQMPAHAPGDSAYGTSRQEELFGRDLLLDETEGIAIDNRYGALDFDLVSGVDNMVQAIGIKLDTEQGSNVLYPTFGRTPLIGLVNTMERRILAEVDAERIMLEDPRVDEVLKVTFEVSGDTVSTDLTLKLADWSTVRAQGRL